MITRITKLKNFGIFHDVSWGSCPDFKRFNLIYGWNRSGKTTLSRVFSACERRTMIFDEYPENGEFELKTTAGSNVKNTELDDCTLPIKVFNHDFIEENVSFDPENLCNPIIYISEEDIERKKELEKLKREKLVLESDLESVRNTKVAKERNEENFRKTLALSIASHNTKKSSHDYYFSYTRDKVKNRIEIKGIDGFAKLRTEQFDRYKKIINSDVKPEQRYVAEFTTSLKHSGKDLSTIDDILTLSRDLTSKKIIARTIARLRDDHELNHWVKQGYDLHRQQASQKCLFCEKQLDTNFMDVLAEHFSEDYEALQKDIEETTKALEVFKSDKKNESSVDLYADLRSDYAEAIRKINVISVRLNDWIDEVIVALKEKYKNPLSVVSAPKKPKDFIIEYNAIVNDINSILRQHNQRVANHDDEVKAAKEKIELHLIATAIEKQNYRMLKKELDGAVVSHTRAVDNLKKADDDIATLERTTSDIGNAVVQINQHLEKFFGRKEIQLELDRNKKGYIIKRDGNRARNLSESEKTAIAFSYFIVKVMEKDFNIRDGIIFIDDPISSFDSNFVYHCFSVITNHLKDASQLFVSTHNFELFNLVKEWFLNKNRPIVSYNKGKKENEMKELPSEFYMIENYHSNGNRYARLTQLEATLRNFKSEYHYLFSLLCRFAGKEQPHYDDFYIIGNIARRFLEIFANFKIPRVGDLRGKVNDIVRTVNQDAVIIGEIERDKVYKLIQEFSHGYDPTSMIEHKDKAEINDGVDILLKIIKHSDPIHYNLLGNTN